MFENGFLASDSGPHGVWVTTDDMSIDRFEELTSALASVLDEFADAVAAAAQTTPTTERISVPVPGATVTVLRVRPHRLTAVCLTRADYCSSIFRTNSRSRISVITSPGSVSSVIR